MFFEPSKVRKEVKAAKKKEKRDAKRKAKAAKRREAGLGKKEEQLGKVMRTMLKVFSEKVLFGGRIIASKANIDASPVRLSFLCLRL